jgi:hypothetical protein
MYGTHDTASSTDKCLGVTILYSDWNLYLSGGLERW